MIAHAATQAVRDLETWTQEGGIDLAVSNPDDIANMLDGRLTSVKHRRAEEALVSYDHACCRPHCGVIKSRSLMCKEGSVRHEDSPTNLTTVEKLPTCVEVICIVLTAVQGSCCWRHVPWRGDTNRQLAGPEVTNIECNELGSKITISEEQSRILKHIAHQEVGSLDLRRLAQVATKLSKSRMLL